MKLMLEEPEIKVFIIQRESTYSECKEILERKSWITVNRNKGALCLSCADMDHLLFLSAGDASLKGKS